MSQNETHNIASESTALTLGAAEQLLAIREIERVFAARLRVMDNKQWEYYPTLHTEDVVSETWQGLPGDKRPSTDGESGRVVGRTALTRAISNLLDGPVKVTSAHHGHCPEIVLESDTTARGIWAMEDRLWWDNAGTEESLHGWGHYHERYTRVDGVWLISYRKLTRLRQVHTPGFFSFLKPL